MSKLQQLAQKKSSKPGGLSRLLGTSRIRPNLKTLVARDDDKSRCDEISGKSQQVEESDDKNSKSIDAKQDNEIPNLFYEWTVQEPVSSRIINGDSNLSNSSVTQIWFKNDMKREEETQHSIKVKFTNKPIKVAKPKKKKNKKKPEDVESVEPQMAKLTLAPKNPKQQPASGAKPIKMDILTAKAEMPTLSFITIGHVDSGKSTTLGRFLYDLNVISGRQLNALAKQAKDAGKGSFSLAWIMDQTPEERSRGVTVDTVQCGIEINGRKLVLVDSPGHQDYLPSVVNGVIGADVAVVIVDSSNDLIFNLSSTSASSIIHTREQLLIAKSLGISKLLILINKLDSPSFDDSQMKFDTIVNSIKDTLVDSPPEGFGFDEDSIKFIPISGIHGDNIVNPSINMPWYENGTMLSTLESWWDAKKENDTSVKIDEPFIFNITDVINNNSENTAVSKVKDNEVIAFGRVHSGYVQQGDILIDSFGGERGQVDGIWSQQSLISNNANDIKVDERSTEKVASKGDFIELKMKKVGTPQNITSGDVLTKDINSSSVIAQTVNNFIIDISTFELERPLLIGSPIVIFRGGRAYDGKIQSIDFVVVKSTTSAKLVKKKNRSHLGSNQRAQVNISVDSGMGIVLINEDLKFMGKLNRVIIRKDSKSVAGGIIKSIQL